MLLLRVIDDKWLGARGSENRRPLFYSGMWCDGEVRVLYVCGFKSDALWVPPFGCQCVHLALCVAVFGCGDRSFCMMFLYVSIWAVWNG